MKRMKKLASLLLAMVMVLSMTVAAFADNVETPKGQGDFTITVRNEKSGHTYVAYQIFKGDLLEKDNETKDKVLSNIEWGEHVTNPTGLIAALKSNSAFNGKFKDVKDARGVAEVLEKNQGADFVREFAKVVGAQTYDENAKTYVKSYLDVSTLESDDETEKTEGEKKIYEYKINSLKAGYYLVEDKVGSVAADDAYTSYIMEVVANVTAREKSETPTIDKKIVGQDGLVESNTAGLGQVVSYQITGKVPDTTGYKKYFYVIEDTFSGGLTYNNDVVVEYGTLHDDGTFTSKGTLTTKTENIQDTDAYYNWYTTERDKDSEDANKGKEVESFKIAFMNIGKLTAGDDIVVRYSATVNSKAVLGVAGNPNTAKLVYSNNPNSDQDGDKEGEPGIPSDDVPKGTTPDEIVITYVAGIDITKTFSDLTGTAILPGAEFTLTGNSTQTILKNATYYKVSDDESPVDGKTYYYLLLTGEYTDTAPHGFIKGENGEADVESNEHFYANTDRYERVTVQDKTTVTVPVKIVGVTNSQGKLVFKGLGAGKYTIEETGVPEGYNKAPNVTVEIKCNLPEKVETGKEEATWEVGNETSYHVNKDGITVKDARLYDNEGNSGVYHVAIENKSGALLPSTGGIGRTIFYAAGIILMAGAMFFVVRRKRA